MSPYFQEIFEMVQMRYYTYIFSQCLAPRDSKIKYGGCYLGTLHDSNETLIQFI